MKEASDSEEYKIKITECNLYVPIAQASATVFNELSSILASKSVALHYRRTEIRPLAIPKEKEEFNSDNLFPDEVPCRLIFCFVEESAKKGDYLKSPFEFRRSWLVTETSEAGELSREDLLERELKDLRAKFVNLEALTKSFLEDSTSRGKQTNVRQRKDSLPDSSLFGRLRSSFGTQGDNDSLASEAGSSVQLRDGPDPTPPVKTKHVYIKKVELRLNNSVIDQLDADETKNECVMSYYRFFNSSGFRENTPFTNSITYDDFRNGYYFAIFDLSTSSKCFSANLVPGKKKLFLVCLDTFDQA